jgi:Protein of unknwon function (DUF3310)
MQPTFDTINKPKHYNSHPSGIECITIAELLPFNVGNAIKYLWRSGLKNGLEDLKKARWYVEREASRIFTPLYIGDTPHPPGDIAMEDISKHMPRNIGAAFDHLWRHSFGSDDTGNELVMALAYIEIEIADRTAAKQTHADWSLHG